TLTTEGLAFAVTVDGLTGPITAAHFHNGAPGVNGGVVRPITTEFGAGNTAVGVWKPSDASPLTPALIAELIQGNLYVNVHTAANPGGEIRGQSRARTIAGVEEPGTTGALRFSSSPNPVQGRVSFSFFLPRACDVNLRLFDLG